MNELFSPKKIKGITIKNRIVLPPIARFGWSGEDGVISEDHLRSYEIVAKGGCGLIIIEALSVLEEARVSNPQLGIWSDKHIEGIRRIGEVCHRHGARVIAQLNHGGFKIFPGISRKVYSPSSYNYYGTEAEELSTDKIRFIQDNFLSAAKRIKRASLDGIEIHGAHGFLIGQFMSPITNKRKDSYGGDIAGRTRFATELINRLYDTVADDNFLLSYRLGANEPSLSEGIEIAQIIEKSGIDLLHVSSGLEPGIIPKIPEDFKFSWIVYCGTEIKKHIKIPVIVVKNIKLPGQAEYLIENNMADFTAIGKAQLIDPDWAYKAENNMGIDACLVCNKCSWLFDGRKCPRYSSRS